MDWKTKAFIFRALDFLPFKRQIHYRLQRHVTNEWPRRAEHLDQLLDAARRLLEAVHSHGGKTAGNFLEIGAGRDLATAVAARLLGVDRVTCVDVARLAKPQLIGHAAAHFARVLGQADPMIRTWADVERFGITYVAPTRLQDSRLREASFDVFFSVDTLEHIPPVELVSVLATGKRLLRPAGLQVHFVDYSDHYARGNNLSRFNFLTYDQHAWKRFNSSFQFVNRLRHSQYLKVLEAAGLATRAVHPDVMPAEPAVLDNLAPQFHGFEHHDLFTTRALLVAQALPS